MADSKKTTSDKAPIIIIKKVKKGGGGHHGGAWKVAYADFVTAMMAFFLLMWLLGVATEDQKKGLAEYFSPNVVSSSKSGAGGVLGGTEISEEDSKNDTQEDVVEDPEQVAKEKLLAGALDKEDEKAFDGAKEEIAQEIEKNIELKAFKDNIVIDVTSEGLRIQIIDSEKQPMFQLGSAIPMPQTVALIKAVTKIIKNLPNQISVRGHTDSKQYGKNAAYTNWELSADRANTSRRIMLEEEMPEGRIKDVQGKSDHEHFDVTNPDSPKNRRVTIMLLRQSLVRADSKAKEAFKKRSEVKTKKKDDKKKREEGVIYFP